LSEQLVSVVTPFHNTSEFLAECVGSVLGQSHTNFEYVLVDNQSTDGSLEIVEELVSADSRLRLLHTPRLLNQVENYNFALRSISTESSYCKIVQADDWIFPHCLAEMLSVANEYPQCGVISAYELAGSEVYGDFMEPYERHLDGREAGRRFIMLEHHMFGSPTTVMYRADLVRSRPEFYEADRLHEDTEIVLELLQFTDFGFVPQVLSYTRPRPGSLSDRARPMLTHLLDQLIVAVRFGPEFLSPAEFEAVHARRRRTYYRALARKALKSPFGNDEKFWEFQRKGLATIGETLDRWEIARQLPGAVIERLPELFQ
jgi:glycosyltransferase involved in cell wall biosynthesis